MTDIQVKNKYVLYWTIFLPILIFSILLAWGFYQFDRNTRLLNTQSSTGKYVELQVQAINLTFQQIFSDLSFLNKQQALLNYLDNNSEDNIQVLEQDYFVFSHHKKLYDQIWFLDSSGQERIRINYNDGLVKKVEQEKL